MILIKETEHQIHLYIKNWRVMYFKITNRQPITKDQIDLTQVSYCPLKLLITLSDIPVKNVYRKHKNMS